ncbi:MAG: hypothetical protein ACYDHW_01305 [Syntrophorhabdaceae bacterium]
MYRILVLVFLFTFISLVGCEKADQALEAVEKAKNLKSDIEKKYNDTKKDLTGKADEFKEKARKEGILIMDGKEKKKSGQEGDKQKEEKEGK